MRVPGEGRIWRAGGVATLAIAMLIGAMGCVGRAPVVARDDASITTDVRARLAADDQMKPYAIGVDTKMGVVSLTGSVAKDADRISAERIARDAPGVRSVDNNVRYGAVPASAGN